MAILLKGVGELAGAVAGGLGGAATGFISGAINGRPLSGMLEGCEEGAELVGGVVGLVGEKVGHTVNAVTDHVPIVGHGKAAVQAAVGDEANARKARERANLVSRVVDKGTDGVPVVGHAKWAVCRATGKADRAKEIARSANRTTAAVAVGVATIATGGAAGAVLAATAAGAVAYGAVDDILINDRDYDAKTLVADVAAGTVGVVVPEVAFVAKAAREVRAPSTCNKPTASDMDGASKAVVFGRCSVQLSAGLADHWALHVNGIWYEVNREKERIHYQHQTAAGASPTEVFHVRSLERLGYHSKTEEEIETWLEDWKSSHNYDLVTCNCQHFVTEFAEFLGVSVTAAQIGLLFW